MDAAVRVGARRQGNALKLMSLLLFLTVICAASLSFALLSIVGLRRLVGPGFGKVHNEVLAAIFGVGGTIYAVFLAFLVITVWNVHEEARVNVADEASQLSTLYRSSHAMEPESGARLRQLIRDYT